MRSRIHPLLAGLALCFTLAGARSAAAPEPALARVQQHAAALALELARGCPVADPANQAAFDDCRRALFNGTALRGRLPDFVLWGRERDPKIALANAKLTQFGPDAFAGMYAPLFMFDGRHTVEYVEREDLYLIRLPTAFRNRLAPGQFPYPFWHDAEKWAMYEKANELLLWFDPRAERIKVAQFTVFGRNPALVATAHQTPPSFDGQWTWTDARGQSQPMVTLFDGLFSAANPYIGELDRSYRRFALRLREGQCDQCHVPNNPDGMKRLVLLQSPAHAAAEIDRVLKSVHDERMPRDEVGIEQRLDPKIKAALLSEGEAFAAVVGSARQWEAAHTAARATPGATPVAASGR